MKLISFDVGIKNMAYCILDLSGTSFQIKGWNVLNLMNQVETTSYICNCKVKTKKEEKVCGKQAKYKKENMYFCTQHANSNKIYMMFQKDLTSQSLKKKKPTGFKLRVFQAKTLLNKWKEELRSRESSPYPVKLAS